MAATPSTTAPMAASALLAQYIEQIFAAVPAVLSGEPTAVHDLRVAARRLHAVLPLMVRQRRGKRVRRARRTLRRLIRAAGPSRDLDVGLQLLHDHQRPGGSGAGPPADVAGDLREARDRSQRRMVEAFGELELRRLRRDLRRLAARRVAAPRTLDKRFDRARARQGARGVHYLEALGDAFDPVSLHALRRWARRLRYVAEAADALGGVTSDAPSVLRQLQQEIGRIHDSYVLAERLELEARVSARQGRHQVARAAEALRSDFAAAARGWHRTLLEHGAQLCTTQGLGGAAPPQRAD